MFGYSQRQLTAHINLLTIKQNIDLLSGGQSTSNYFGTLVSPDFLRLARAELERLAPACPRRTAGHLRAIAIRLPSELAHSVRSVHLGAAA